MVEWPETLIKELSDRRCILFLGSGISASAQDKDGNRPPTWKAFIESALLLVKDTGTRQAIGELIKKENFLIALEAIKSNSDPADYRQLIDKSFNSPSYKPSEIHKTIYNLDSRMVITTNFDNIYEQYWTHFSEEGFKTVYYNDESLGDEIRSDNRLIIKAHGGVNNQAKMIFTRSEYHAAKAQHPNFYEMLRALLLTHTVVFLGCGMTDPDVLLTLEEVKISSSGARPHYALLRTGEASEFVVKDLSKSYNIKVLEYGPEHSDLQAALTEALESVELIRAGGLSIVEDEPELG